MDEIKKGDTVTWNSENRLDYPARFKTGKVIHVFKGVDLKVKCPDGDYFVMKWACKKVDE